MVDLSDELPRHYLYLYDGEYERLIRGLRELGLNVLASKIERRAK